MSANFLPIKNVIQMPQPDQSMLNGRYVSNDGNKDNRFVHNSTDGYKAVPVVNTPISVHRDTGFSTLPYKKMK